MILSWKNLLRSVSHRVQEKCSGVLGTVYLPVSTNKAIYLSIYPLLVSNTSVQL